MKASPENIEPVHSNSLFNDDDDDEDYYSENEAQPSVPSLNEPLPKNTPENFLSQENSTVAGARVSEDMFAPSKFDDDEDKDYELEENEENSDFVINNVSKKTKSKNRNKRKISGGEVTQTAKSQKHKHSFSARHFMDVEALVGDDDDYDESLADEDSEFIKDVAESQQQLDHDLVHQRRFQYSLASASPQGGVGHLASAIGNLERRYQDYDKETIDEEYEDETAYYKKADDPTRFIPDAADAKLWVVATNKGITEREIVISIMNKAEHLRRRNIFFPILSVFAADGIKGKIYVEAESPARIIDALSGLRSVNTTRITMVPFKEIGTIYTMGNKAPKIVHYGDLVRFRAGIYAGDLGQVTENDEHTGFALVRVVPRIKLEDLLLRQRSKTEAPAKERLQETRPPARLVTREEIETRGGLLESGSGKSTFRLGAYLFEETGYLLRKVRIRALITGDEVVPTVSELKEFSKTISMFGSQETDSATSLVPSWKSLLTDRLLSVSGTSNYQIGDMVILQAGDLAGLKGQVTAVEGKTLYIIPEGLKDRIAINGVEAIKYFEIGDSVKVVSGTHQGKSGLVTALDLEKGIATVFWPELNKSFHCSLCNLQKCPNSSLGTEGMSALSGFAVEDLVQLAREQTGVIVRIDAAHTFSVLTTENQLVTVPLSGLAAKRSNEFGFSLDSKNNQFGLKATVVLHDPMFKRATGRVLHIWKNYIFVKLSNKDITPSGYRVCRGQDLMVTNMPDQHSIKQVSSSVASNHYDPNSYFKNKPFVGDTGNLRTTGNDKQQSYSNGPQFYRTRNRFFNCRLKIIGTRNKGQYGKAVAFGAGNDIKIQLENSPQVVTVKKSDVMILDKPIGNSNFAKQSSSFTQNSNNQWNEYFDSVRSCKEKEISGSSGVSSCWWKTQSPLRHKT